MVRSASSLRDIRQDNRGSLHQANSRQLEGLKNVLQELKSFDSQVRSCFIINTFFNPQLTIVNSFNHIELSAQF